MNWRASSASDECLVCEANCVLARGSATTVADRLGSLPLSRWGFRGLWNDWVDDRPRRKRGQPFARCVVWLATAGGIAALALAGLLFYLAIPVEDGGSTRVDDRVGCGDVTMMFLGGGTAVLIGVWLVIYGLLRAREAKSRFSASVSLSGVGLIALSVALLLLYSRLNWYCESD
jgi:hypothetical protein